MPRRQHRRGVIRDSLLMGGAAFFSSTAVLAQVAGATPALPGGDLTAILTQTGITGMLVFFLVQSMRREVDQARTFAAELKEMADKQNAQAEKLMTAVLERLPRAERKEK